ncbi:hypothetical protein HPB49_025605 [Dermacentor silvarum]|uniref:Uncharacterized protein n=1 Tax=Dermacentor silvarum TaxID=543639 RepID=A0ACB8CIQ5_DERSI|nr:hypothetical protein HPB49_025605 [Dermacentor silvarum]
MPAVAAGTAQKAAVSALAVRKTTQDWPKLQRQFIFHFSVLFGWFRGPKCDECKPLPGCLHGHCTKPLECICDPGWTGIFCHIPVCSPKCHHEHGYCARPNECRCRVGWMGENCSQCCPYPGCRHGSCNKPWECTCEPGWGGMLCDKPLPPACEATDPPPCAEGTTCIDMPDGGFKCACPEGAQASNCTAATSERRRTMLR